LKAYRGSSVCCFAKWAHGPKISLATNVKKEGTANKTCGFESFIHYTAYVSSFVIIGKAGYRCAIGFLTRTSVTYRL
jgi:hypothetical protein